MTKYQKILQLDFVSMKSFWYLVREKFLNMFKKIILNDL